MNQRRQWNDDVDLVMQSSSIGPRTAATRPDQRENLLNGLFDNFRTEFHIPADIPLTLSKPKPTTTEEELVPLQDVNLTIRNGIKESDDEEDSDNAHNKACRYLWQRPTKEMGNSYLSWRKSPVGWINGSKAGAVGDPAADS